MTLSRFPRMLGALISCWPCCVLFVLAGCVSSIDPNAIDYHSQDLQSSASLWLPPDVIHPVSSKESPNSAAVVPAQHAFVVDKSPAQHYAASKIHLERDGTQYWLRVEGQTVEQLIPQIEKFWRQQNFELINPDAHQPHGERPQNLSPAHLKDRQSKDLLDDLETDSKVIETQWREMPASVNTGFIRSQLSKVFDTRYVTRQKNKYRTRIEVRSPHTPYIKQITNKNAHGPSNLPVVLIFVSQSVLKEERTGPTKEVSQWKLAPHDIFSEALILQRLMFALIEQSNSSKQVDAVTTRSQPSTVALIQTKPMRPSNKVLKDIDRTGLENTSVLIIPKPFEQAWFEIGMALERLNFTVEDRDRAQGLYDVRYVDPYDQSTVRQGFWSQLLHGRKEKKAQTYKLNVQAVKGQGTRLVLLDDSGAVDTTLQAKRIVALLKEAIQMPIQANPNANE